MRRKDKEIRDKEIIEQLLAGSDICRIAMVRTGNTTVHSAA